MTNNKTNEAVHPQKTCRQQANIVDIEWQWADDGKWIMMNNKTNEVVQPQKMRPSSKSQNHAGGGGIYHLSPSQLYPKPSAGGVANGVWMMPLCLVGVPPGHMWW